jgi:hypothetical protein
MNMDMDMNMISRKVTRVRAASVDTNPLTIQESPSKNLNPKPNNSVLTPPLTESASLPTFTLTAQAVSDVFKRKTVIVQGKGTPHFHTCFSLSLLMFLEPLIYHERNIGLLFSYGVVVNE